jgi:hypothetical protein
LLKPIIFVIQHYKLLKEHYETLALLAGMKFWVSTARLTPGRITVAPIFIVDWIGSLTFAPPTEENLKSPVWTYRPDNYTMQENDNITAQHDLSKAT